MFEILRHFKYQGFLPAFIWLFIQLSMTGVFLPANASTVDGLSQADFPNSIIICTSSGFKRIILNADGTKPQDTPDEESYCPWCLHFGKLPPLVTPSDWQTASFTTFSNIDWHSADFKCIYQHARVHFKSRAPPL